MSGSQYTQNDSAEVAAYSADADWCVLDGVHIDTTWRMRLNRLCAAVMWPYVIIIIHSSTVWS